jgi:hypothetical protein
MSVEKPEAGGTRLRASAVTSATHVPRFSVGERIADAYEVKRIIEHRFSHEFNRHPDITWWGVAP